MTFSKEEIEMIEREAKSYAYALWQPHFRFEDEIEQTIVDFKRGYMVALKAERQRAGKLMEALEGFIDFPEEDLRYWIEQNRPVVTTVVPQLFHNAKTAINEYNNKP